MLTMLTGLFTIIIAAGIVANEFNWGTIKLLVIRPLSRFQILLSKYITVLLFGLGLLLFLFVGSTLLGLLFFGTGGDAAANVHLVYKDGHVVEQSIIGYLAKTYLYESISAFMLATMAFMLSAVFRNSSLAVGFSIFLLVMGSTATGFLAMKFDWAKYILFANTDLTQYLDGTPLVEGMTMTFSIVMLVIYFVIFQMLAFGVFLKRDIAT